MEETEEKLPESEAYRDINVFCKNFEARHGVRPIVIVPGEQFKLPKLPLAELEAIANKHIAGTKRSKDMTIRTHRRFEELVLPRQIFFKMAMDMGYGCYQTGVAIGYDHATVLHSTEEVNEKLESGDRKITELFLIMQREAKERINSWMNGSH